MTKGFYNLALGIICSLVFTQGVFAGIKRDDDKMHRAIEANAKKDLDEAYKILETVEPQTLSYRMAYFEMQKMHYKTQSWEKFFGYAGFYRKKLMTLFLQPELLVLETMALTKHCQFEAASKIIGFSRTLLQELNRKEEEQNPVMKAILQQELKRQGNSKTALQAILTRFEAELTTVENLLQLQGQMPGPINANAVAHRARIFSKDLFWNIENSQAKEKIIDKAVRTPSILRVFVKNLCQKQAGL